MFLWANTVFYPDDWRGGVEIGFLFLLVYGALFVARGVRGARQFFVMALGFATFAILIHMLRLEVLGWLVENFFLVALVALMVAFQPELRRCIMEIGSRSVYSLAKKQAGGFVDQLVEAMVQLSHRRFGALFALKKEMDLTDYADTGVTLDAKFSRELLLTIFHPKTALHDGGLIIVDERLSAAACIFPVSQSELLDRSMGLRHRAALGITEHTDSIGLVVSEETGQFSICYRGKLEHDLDPPTVRRRLRELLYGPPDPTKEAVAPVKGSLKGKDPGLLGRIPASPLGTVGLDKADVNQSVGGA